MELTTPATAATWNFSRVQLELPSGDSKTRLRAAAQEFESLFAKQMLDSMRDTLNTEDDIFNGGMAQDIFEDMLYEEYGRIMARTGSLGIADLIVRQYESAYAEPETTRPGGDASRVATMYDSLQS